MNQINFWETNSLRTGNLICFIEESSRKGPFCIAMLVYLMFNGLTINIWGYNGWGYVVSCSKFEREQQNNHHKIGFNMIYGNHPETV